jgi:Flp pilus assembly protein TadB
MLRFLFGILVVQAATAGLVFFTASKTLDWNTWLPILVALSTIGLIAAFWFSTVATGLRHGEIDRLRNDFARERENLRVKAEREKTRMVRQNQKSLASETRRAEGRANRKVAMAVGAVSAIGVVLMFASSLALGLSLLTGAGGALGGYITGRRARVRPAVADNNASAGKPLLRRLLRSPTSRLND